MYFIHDSVLQKLRQHANEKGLSLKDQIYEEGVNTEEVIHNLATLVYKYDDANRTRATLYHIYHHCIHDRVQVARDYLLMSKITDNVQNVDSTL